MSGPVQARKISDNTYQLVCPECGGTTNFRSSTIGGKTKCRNCGLPISITISGPPQASSGCTLTSCLILSVLIAVGIISVLSIIAVIGARSSGDAEIEKAQHKGRHGRTEHQEPIDPQSQSPHQSKIADSAGAEVQGTTDVMDEAENFAQQSTQGDTLSEKANAAPKHQTKHELRTWTSENGEFQKEAGFFARASDTVTLELENGDKIKVEIDDLSEVDQEYLEKRLFRNR